MGTFSPDRQPSLERLMLDAARRSSYRFVVAGPGYQTAEWPASVRHLDHVPASEHRAFYTSLRFTLNLTRADMIRAGYSPSVRLFEAAACGVPIISDVWDGIDTFFVPDHEILLARSARDVLTYLHDICEEDRRAIGDLARRRVLESHTAAHRAAELESYVTETSIPR